tara:strand:+ start:49 stop:213 length:165 start_codon:yes stop_codon:yes gene_type:complete
MSDLEPFKIGFLGSPSASISIIALKPKPSNFSAILALSPTINQLTTSGLTLFFS